VNIVKLYSINGLDFLAGPKAFALLA